MTQFRAKGRTTRHWRYGRYHTDNNSFMIIDDKQAQFHVDPYTLEQFTGLLDRFNKPIYKPVK